MYGAKSCSACKTASIVSTVQKTEERLGFVSKGEAQLMKSQCPLPLALSKPFKETFYGRKISATGAGVKKKDQKTKK
jgi:hypothetical protein